LWLAGIPFGQFWDAATITILVGMVFTKIGCMLNGCCAGRETQRRGALYLPNVAGIWRRRVPSQLLEAALAGVLLLTAPMLWRRLPFPGVYFLSALFAYAVGRFWLENTRENIDRIWGLSLNRVISGLLATLSITVLVLHNYARHLRR
jgi:phosphatidylglycerol:prolipoprotein diacylglycerol transferase